MDELVTWLRAQLDEDEAVAKAAESGTWRWEEKYGDLCNDPTCEYGELIADTKPVESVLMQVHGYEVKAGWQGAAHIARHDPARVLREVASHRAIIDQHQAWADALTVRTLNGLPSGNTEQVFSALCRVVQSLGTIYADRPGYREGWTS